jgi:hypothetical protein
MWHVETAKRAEGGSEGSPLSPHHPTLFGNAFLAQLVNETLIVSAFAASNVDAFVATGGACGRGVVCGNVCVA